MLNTLDILTIRAENKLTSRVLLENCKRLPLEPHFVYTNFEVTKSLDINYENLNKIQLPNGLVCASYAALVRNAKCCKTVTKNYIF